MLSDLNITLKPDEPQTDYYAIGHKFEDFIVTLFNKRKFRLLEWRSDKKASNGVFPLSCSFPDLEFQSTRRNRYRFAIECKWRKKFYDGGVEWANRKQIFNYQEYQRECNIPVFVAIGVGGLPENPDKLFITPLDHVCRFTTVFESHLILFKRNPQQHFDEYEQLELF